MGLFLDPGLGKTLIYLRGLLRLREKLPGLRALVVAPLRVAHNVWPAEIDKWQLPLTYAVAHGKTIESVIAGPADVAITNYDSLRRALPVVRKLANTDLRRAALCLDESTAIKSPYAKTRFKVLAARVGNCSAFELFYHRVIMTGTPIPNGYLDLWAQVYALDLGASLGPRFGKYRLDYFVPSGYMGREWTIAPGAERRIAAKIKHLVKRYSREEIPDLPPIYHVERKFELPDHARRLYDELEKEYVVATARLGRITAVTGGALSVKLRQLTGGALYRGGLSDESEATKREVVRVHDEKLDELSELVEELRGEPLLVACEFDHERDRILERFPDAVVFAGSRAQTLGIIERWNAGEIKLLIGNTKTISLGLNLQGHACYVCVYSPSWNWESHTQCLQRVWRSGQRRPVTVYYLIASDTADEVVVEGLTRKEGTQTDFFKYVTERLIERSTNKEEKTEMLIWIGPKGEVSREPVVGKGYKELGPWGKPQMEAVLSELSTTVLSKAYNELAGPLPVDKRASFKTVDEAVSRFYGFLTAGSNEKSRKPTEEVKMKTKTEAAPKTKTAAPKAKTKTAAPKAKTKTKTAAPKAKTKAAAPKAKAPRADGDTFAGYPTTAKVTALKKKNESPFREGSIRDVALAGILAAKTVGDVRDKVSRDPWHLQTAVKNKFVKVG